MLEYIPELGTLRKFVDAIHRLLATEQSEHQAWCGWWALQRNETFRAVGELARVLEMLTMPEFKKMIAFLRGPARQIGRAHV